LTLRTVGFDQVISACGGDAREAVKALIVANDFLEALAPARERKDETDV
jgi:hypothetical protein